MYLYFFYCFLNFTLFVKVQFYESMLPSFKPSLWYCIEKSKQINKTKNKGRGASGDLFIEEILKLLVLLVCSKFLSLKDFSIKLGYKHTI